MIMPVITSTKKTTVSELWDPSLAWDRAWGLPPVYPFTASTPGAPTLPIPHPNSEGPEAAVENNLESTGFCININM